MPTFDFKCKQCGITYDKIAQSSDEVGIDVCPECNASGAQRMWSKPQIKFNCSGWSRKRVIT